jgi:hypothetical protein
MSNFRKYLETIQEEKHNNNKLERYNEDIMSDAIRVMDSMKYNVMAAAGVLGQIIGSIGLAEISIAGIILIIAVFILNFLNKTSKESENDHLAQLDVKNVMDKDIKKEIYDKKSVNEVKTMLNSFVFGDGNFNSIETYLKLKKMNENIIRQIESTLTATRDAHKKGLKAIQKEDLINIIKNKFKK